MPRPPRSGKRFAALAAAVLAALLATGPAAAYVIYLQDGSKIVAQEKYELRGGKAYIVLQNGTRTMIDAAEIDAARTEEANRTNLGSAVVLEDGEAVEARPAPAPPPPTLRDLVRRDPAPPPRPATANGAATSLPRTASGHLDLAGLPRRPLADTDLAARIAGLYGEHDIAPVQVTRGSSDARALVEATTSSEAAVFRTLAVTAASLAGLGAQGARLEAIELLMTTPNGERAGQFVVTPELAVELLEGRVDVAMFYLAHVQF
jgi:hypothetical protein